MRAATRSGLSGVGMLRMIPAGAWGAAMSSSMGKSDLLALVVPRAARIESGIDAGEGWEGGTYDGG